MLKGKCAVRRSWSEEEAAPRNGSWPEDEEALLLE
jgi:hypothetical protein